MSVEVYVSVCDLSTVKGFSLLGSSMCSVYLPVEFDIQYLVFKRNILTDDGATVKGQGVTRTMMLPLGDDEHPYQISCHNCPVVVKIICSEAVTRS